MFTKEMYKKEISPSFLNSILTNTSLYKMFRDDFQENSEYFHNIKKEIYLEELNNVITEKLFSKNFLNVYNEDDIDRDFVIIRIIKNFYCDFLLPLFKSDASTIFKSKFLRGMRFSFLEDKYASKNEKFMDFYKFVFASINYEDAESKIISPLKEKLHNNEKLSPQEFDLLLDYVTNNLEGKVNMQLISDLIRAHAYKKNHIFASDVIEELVRSTAVNYLKRYNVNPTVTFTIDIFESEEDKFTNYQNTCIKIKSIFLNTFMSGNYVELFFELLKQLTIIENIILLRENKLNYKTYLTVIGLINYKVDINRIFIDENYEPYTYFTDLKASIFLKTLIFYQSMGVNLIQNYIKSKIKVCNLNDTLENISNKEHSLGALADYNILRMDRLKWDVYFQRYNVLRVFYNENGTKKRTIDIIKSINDSNFTLISEYIHSEVIEPDLMIQDVVDLIDVEFEDENAKNLVSDMLSFLYPDTFYYSIKSFSEIYKNKAWFNRNIYLNDLLIKIECIKNNQKSQNFIDSAIMIINDEKQNSD